MAFDPTIPSGHGPLSSADMRNQLNALKALIDAQQATITSQQAQLEAHTQMIAELQDAVAALQANP